MILPELDKLNEKVKMVLRGFAIVLIFFKIIFRITKEAEDVTFTHTEYMASMVLGFVSSLVLIKLNTIRSNAN